MRRLMAILFIVIVSGVLVVFGYRSGEVLLEEHVALRPNWNEGDVWIYQKTRPNGTGDWTAFVADTVEDNLVNMNRYAYNSRWLVDQYGARPQLDLNSGEIIPEIHRDHWSPRSMALFPLELGKTWESRDFQLEVISVSQDEFQIQADHTDQAGNYYIFVYSVEARNLIKLTKYLDFSLFWEYELVLSGNGDEDGDGLPGIVESQLSTSDRTDDTDGDGTPDDRDVYPLGRFSYLFEIWDYELNATDVDESGEIDPYIRFTTYRPHWPPDRRNYSTQWNSSGGNFSFNFTYWAPESHLNDGYTIQLFDEDVNGSNDEITSAGGIPITVQGWNTTMEILREDFPRDELNHITFDGGWIDLRVTLVID